MLLTRAFGVVLALVCSIVLNGCDGSTSLLLEGPTEAAIGDPMTFYVVVDEVCNGKVFGGPSDPTGEFCSGGPKVTKLLDAACDDDACVVESIAAPDADGAVRLAVVGSAPGPTVLRVRAAIDDGSEMSATAALSFVTPTGLSVSCDPAQAGAQELGVPYGQCGGLYPVFTDSDFKWTISFQSDAGPIPSFNPSVAVEGDALTFDSASGWFHAGSTTGTAQVMISSSSSPPLTKTVPVRVASANDVVSGELRLVTPTDGIDQAIAQIGPAPSTLWFPSQGGRHFDGEAAGGVIQVLLMLSDGTQAYGGGGLFASDHPEVCTLAASPPGANLLQQTSVHTDCLADGSATFTATVGAATIAWPVTVVPPPGP
jgi:hypothetical protein